tara:strand:- start:45 stop:728 length:684 start_codon:yes stop_codon:yes gene_type:complete
MDLIQDHQGKQNTYSQKINSSKYIEGENKTVTIKGVNDILELIIGNNDIQYATIEKKQKTHYIEKKKLEIAENIVKSDLYSKNFNVQLLQNGFQNINHLSSILYLNEYYKINCIIYNDTTDRYYHTSLKDYPKLLCIYKHNSWFIDTKGIQNEIVKFYDINDLSNILTMDITDINIFKPYLLHISKYKIKDLEDMCNNINIPVKVYGKRRLKQELYNDINLYYLKNE